jgi:hypothetical protein
VALAQIFGNDDIERFSYCFRFLKPENPLCAAVPETK